MVSRFFEFDSTLRFQRGQKVKPNLFTRLWSKAGIKEPITQKNRSYSESTVLASAHLSWENVCSSVSEEFGLSPRECEVMYLLSIGRNAQRISEILHISLSTTKSHVYRIYQKMHIHTQQEIIDCVERHACGSGNLFIA